ncbi:hypothetical protein BH23GEM6_BH23GEM6_09980 [soil metagenome]
MITALLSAGILSWSAFAPAAASANGDAASLAQQQPPFSQLHDQPWDDRYTSQNIRARILVDGNRDLYRSGERLRVRFSTSEDAYVALVHVDPDGRLEFLFPSSPWDNDFIRGGRTHQLPMTHQSGLTIRNRPGIGYLYLIASPYPLDYRHFSRGRGNPWDWSYAGRDVIGDPFWAMGQISRLLVGNSPFASDYYSYHVDGRHRYPAYACADRYLGVSGGWGWSSSYGSCNRLDMFLRQHPHYYDSRLYRGDRRAYMTRTYGAPVVQHRFKEDAVGGRVTDRAPEQPRNRAPAQTVREQERTAAPTTRTGVRQPPAGSPPARAAEPRQSEPQRQRPTLERRGTQRESGSRAPEATPQRERREPQRERPTPAAQSNERPTRSAQPRAAPARPAEPTRAAPNRRPPNDDT